MFRPFAPSTLLEAAPTYFDFGSPIGVVESPFMLLTARVRPDKQHLLPAITHVDGTARVQTVTRAQNPLYYALIEEFGKLTGVPPGNRSVAFTGISIDRFRAGKIVESWSQNNEPKMRPRR